MKREKPEIACADEVEGRRGANMFLGVEHFDLTQSDARILYLGYLLLLDRLDQPEPISGTVAASVLQRAQKAGLKTILDLVSEDGDRFTQIVRPALKFCDYCVVNEFEAERTTGIEIVREGRVDLDAACKAAKELLAAIFWSRGSSESLPRCLEEARDQTAA
jgi:sugar/nucleoside kinase (ribokinase family)